MVALRGQKRKSAEVVKLTDWHRSYQDSAVILCRAVEAAVASAVQRDGRLLVVNNGAYGARIAEKLTEAGIDLPPSTFVRPGGAAPTR